MGKLTMRIGIQVQNTKAHPTINYTISMTQVDYLVSIYINYVCIF